MFNIKKTILTLAAAACLLAGLAAGARATSAPSGFAAVPGDYNGTVTLTWNSPDAIVPGDKFYVQYSTDIALPSGWDPAAAQVVFVSTLSAVPGAPQSLRVTGLEYGMNGSVPAFNYYFKVWIEKSSVLSTSAQANAIPLTPAYSTTTVALADAEVRAVGAYGGYGSRIAVDNTTGNYYLLASVMPMVSTITAGGAAVMPAITLLKFSPAGAILWYRAYNSTGPVSGSYWTNDQATAMDFDQYSGVVIAAKIDNGANVMLRRYNSAGDIMWTTIIPAGMSSRLNALYDTSGSLYAAGEKYDTTGNLWLAKFDLLTGVQQGSSAFYPNDKSGTYAGSGIAAVYNSYIYVTGTKNIGYNDDIFVEKYSDTWAPAPVLAKAVTAGGLNYDQGRDIKVNAAGIYVTGDIYSTTTYNTSCWTAKYDLSLVPLWQDLYVNGSNSASGAALSLDTLGNVYVTGRENRYDIYQGSNLLLMKYSAGGARLFSLSVDQNGGYEEGYDVKVSSLGVIYAAGSFMNQPGVYKLDLSAASSSLYADKGPFPGSVNLSWVYQANVDPGYYYVQYSTSPSVVWSTAAATSFGTYSYAYQVQNHVVGGLAAARDRFNNIISPLYYFKVWYSKDSVTYYALPNLATSYPAVPDSPAESVITGTDGNLLKNLDGVGVASGYAGPAVARDNAGNVYMLFRAKVSAISAYDSGVGLRKYDSSGNIVWTRFYYSNPAALYYDPKAITTDPAGNVIMVGKEFVSNNNIWVSKVDANGNQLWTKTYNGSGNGTDTANAVAVDASNNVYVTGGAYIGGQTDIVVLKYAAADGAQLAVDTYDGELLNDEGTAIDTAGGYVYVAGKVGVTLTTQHVKMAFLKYDASMARSGTWTPNPFFHEQVADKDSVPYAIKVSTWGDIYAAGYVMNPGTKDAWAGKISPSGVLVSTYASGNYYTADEFQGLTISPAGEIIAAGYTMYPDNTLWFQKLNPVSLGLMWSKKFLSTGLTGLITPTNIITDSRGDFVTGVVISTTGVFTAQPGYFKFSPPTVGLAAAAGAVPGSAELTWVTDVALPAGSSYYVQASTWNGGWNFALAKRYWQQYQSYTEGSLVRLKAGDLNAGRDALGNTTPPYYFQAWYYAGGVSTYAVSGTPMALPNIPAVSETPYPYPLGQLNLITGIGNSSPARMVRSASGDLYLAMQTYVPVVGDTTVVIRKYNAAGAAQWTRYYNSGNSNGVSGAAVDAAGDLYIAGGEGSSYVTDPYVAKYSPAGDLLWNRTIPLSTYSDSFGGVTVGADGNVYLAGLYDGMSTKAALLAKYTPDGILLASATYKAGYTAVRGTGIAYNPVNGQLYVSGAAFINTSTACFWVGSFTSALGPLGDKKYCPAYSNGYSVANAIQADAAGNIYAGGNIYDQYQLDNMFVAKFSPALAEVWSSTYNSPGNASDALQGLTLDVNGGVYVGGLETRNDLTQSLNLFFRKYNADSGDIVWTNTFNSSGNSYERAYDIAVDTAGFVYLPGVYSYGTNYQYAYGYFKYRQFSTAATNPMLTVQVKYNGSTEPLRDVNVYLLAFNQTGGMDPAGIRVSTTDANGLFSDRVPGGFKYFIGLSTPGYIPTMKDQLMDPSGNFYLTLTSDATRQYSLYPRAAADPVSTLTVNVSDGLVAGDYLMGEVAVNKTGEKVAYGVLAASAPAGQLQIFNVPPAAAGTYGVALSIPGKSKFLNFFLDTAFPAVSAYSVDMTSAVSTSAGFDTTGSTVPPAFQGVVRSSPTLVPLSGARVELSMNQCSGTSCYTLASYENLTDVNGQFSFYNIPSSTTLYNVNVKKLGSRSAFDMILISSVTAGTVAQYREYTLAPATYTLTGLVKYNGIPVPNARVMVNGDWTTYATGDDSYSRNWNGAMQSDAQVRTSANGIFTVPGLPDGRVRMNMDFMGTWRDLNAGPDGMYGNADDLRIVISSDASTAPSQPGGNPCRPGTNWILDSGGNCRSAGLITFDIIPASGNTAGRLYGKVVFVTTYTVSAVTPLVVPAEAPVTIMATQNCNDGDCQNRQLGFTSISGTFTASSTTYSITLSSGFSYYASVMSNEWGKMSNFNDQVSLTSTDTVGMDFTLTRSGGLRGSVKMPDGTSFKPNYGINGDQATAATADIEVRGVSVQYSAGTGLDDYGNFEYPNLPPGFYDVYLKPRGGAFIWPPVEVDDVRVSLGDTAEVKVKLQDGLLVQPQIFGLPELSTPTWQYQVLGVPSGFQMNQKNVTEMFFEQPKYSFLYSSATASWEKKFMEPGQYDFYLVLGAKYECGREPGASCDQFANFIGRVKNMAIQKSDSNPNLGTLNQPIPVNILGSVGQSAASGRVVGGRIFTAGDFDKMFANFDNEIMNLIPAVMLYDNAGDLRAFTNAMPDSDGIVGFEAGLQTRSSATILASIAANPLHYLVWGLPPGKYTAVYASPNYPPVSVDVTLPRTDAENAAAFDLDAQDSVVGDIYGVVLSSGTGTPVANALVHLKHRVVEKFSVTDSSGAYRFDNLPTGIYRLEAARDGYVTDGRKTSLAGSDHSRFDFSLLPSEAKITGRVYMSKFPAPSTRAGVRIVAYDETLNVEAPSAYLPKLEAQTDDGGAYEIRGVVPGHKYKLSAMFSGKMPEVVDVPGAVDGVTVLDDIVLRDVPPQIKVKVRRSPDSLSKVDVEIRSPRELLSTPVCKYNPGEVYEAVSADDKVCASSSAVSLALVPGPNNTYVGQFTVSQIQPSYSVCVSAGDNNKMKKVVVYDQVSDAKTEQYIQEEALAGGEISMDAEKEEYSGMELDAGTLSYSTATTDAVNYQDLVGGFFSALPSVRTVKTAKGNVTLETAIKDLMASEVYNMDLSNAQANKPFTLTLKYDKEKVTRTGNLRIYQYDGADGQWKEVPGNYTVDPMTGVVSVDVLSLDGAYRGTYGADTPLARKQFHMSAVRNGRYVPSSTSSSSQSGKFAVFTAKPATGTTAFSAAFEVYNMPNPFSLKAKTVSVSSDGQAILGATYNTSGTLIKYNLPAGKSGNLKFVIYNLAGEKVRTIDEGQREGNQVYYSEWDGRNDNGSKCASGVYFMLAFQDGKKLGAKAHKMAILK